MKVKTAKNFITAGELTFTILLSLTGTGILFLGIMALSMFPYVVTGLSGTTSPFLFPGHKLVGLIMAIMLSSSIIFYLIGKKGLKK